jgi:translation initiation factor IF-2
MTLQEGGITTEEQRPPAAPATRKREGRKAAPKQLVLPQTVSVKHLSELLNATSIEVIKQLMRNGVMASMNQVIDFDVAAPVVASFGMRPKLEQQAAPGSIAPLEAEEEDPSTLQLRPPVVAILGHVDHGKTTLLDTIRKSHIVTSEVGNITQHIGAYQVRYNDHPITFLDTPGHEAFTAIRARGAQLTDIAVLVVAADDGIMAQTAEAINHARAADVPIVVAINKIDSPGADPEKVKRQLSEHSLLVEEWGGDVIAVPLSAKLGEGIEDLLENLLVVSEISELKANPNRSAAGVVVEAKLDRNRGPLATVLVQNGTLRVGDQMVAGTAWGRVKAMVNDLGRRIKEAGPSVPVEVMGFDSLPEAGDRFLVTADEKTARSTAEERLKESTRGRLGALAMEDVYTGIASGEIRELNLVLKADVQGSLEAIQSALEQVNAEKARVRILHAGSGTITESDVLLARASKAIILGFNSTTEPGAEGLAERERVQIRHYDIIYRLTEDVEKALQGILEPTQREIILGRAEIRAVFSARKLAKIAGCFVIDGRITRSASVRIIRDGQVVHEGQISSLRHFKQDVNEMAVGYECGVGIENFSDFQERDLLEAYRVERVRP